MAQRAARDQQVSMRTERALAGHGGDSAPGARVPHLQGVVSLQHHSLLNRRNDAPTGRHLRFRQVAYPAAQWRASRVA